MTTPEGEWLDQQHGIRSRRRWRKLNLGLDAGTHEIVAVELTRDDVGDVSEIPYLLDQIGAEVASMTADGAYDGEAVYDAVAECHPGAKVIIPPRATSVAGETTATPRDRHLALIDEHGRTGWRRRSGYNRRSLIETAMFRYKTIIGRRLQARPLCNQKTEAKIGCNVLNRMARLGMPASTRSTDTRDETEDATGGRSVHQRFEDAEEASHARDENDLLTVSRLHQTFIMLTG